MTDARNNETNHETEEQRAAADAAAGSDATGTTGTEAPAAANTAQTAAEGGAGQSGTAPAGDAPQEQDPLAAAQEHAADLQDQLARRNADLHNLNEEYSRYVRRSKAEIGDHKNAGVQSVAEALMPVLDDLELARQHGDLTEGPLAAIADKLENTLKSQFGIERFGAQGEEFNPMVHEALTNMQSEDVQVPTVAQVIQPGYRFGERILRAARVAVQSPA